MRPWPTTCPEPGCDPCRGEYSLQTLLSCVNLRDQHIVILCERSRRPYAAGLHGYLIGERVLYLSSHQPKSSGPLAFCSRDNLVWPYPHTSPFPTSKFQYMKYPTLTSINKISRSEQSSWKRLSAVQNPFHLLPGH